MPFLSFNFSATSGSYLLSSPIIDLDDRSHFRVVDQLNPHNLNESSILFEYNKKPPFSLYANSEASFSLFIVPTQIPGAMSYLDLAPLRGGQVTELRGWSQGKSANMQREGMRVRLRQRLRAQRGCLVVSLIE
jgi:hypothetical protein